jgi:hypothetical protein
MSESSTFTRIKLQIYKTKMNYRLVKVYRIGQRSNPTTHVSYLSSASSFESVDQQIYDQDGIRSLCQTHFVAVAGNIVRLSMQVTSTHARLEAYPALIPKC